MLSLETGNRTRGTLENLIPITHYPIILNSNDTVRVKIKVACVYQLMITFHIS